MEVLPDSSTIIALSKTGSINLLKKTFGKIIITKEVEREITSGDFPEIGEIRRSIGRWIRVVEAKTTMYMDFEGLGDGERSILSYARGKEDILTIIDEREARCVAEEEGIPYTGTIGLIIFAQEKGNISKNKALEIIKKLSRSDFRMTVELYDWALERLE